MTVENLSAVYIKQLSEIYSAEEAKSIRDIVFMYVLDSDRIKISLLRKEKLAPNEEEKLNLILHRLKLQEPVQYVIGESWFFGLKILLNPSVLIPRPETEFLVDIIIKENQNKTNLQILDICTGSGCIAIALKKNMAGSGLEGWDISNAALTVAKNNALLNHAEVDFYEYDILNSSEFPGLKQFDIIVSNPPYISEVEKVKMQANVLDYEPPLALFVPEANPLVFYKAIASISKELLKESGKVYFEINESYGNELKSYFINQGYKFVKIIPDHYGKDRYLTVQ